MRTKPKGDDGPECEHCHGRIFWAFPVPVQRKPQSADPGAPARKTPRADDKPMPFDAAPVESGALYAVRQDKASERALYVKLRPGQVAGHRAAGGKLYQRHWLTCPKKSDWGKPGKAYSTRNVAR